MRELVEKYPEVKELTEEGWIPGRMEHITREIKTSRSKDNGTKRTLYLLPHEINQKDETVTEEIDLLLKNLKDNKNNNNNDDITLITPEGVNRIVIRKIAEYVMYGGTNVVQYMVPQSRKRTTTIMKQQWITKENRYKADAVIIKTSGKTYAEMLSKIKQEVDICKTDIYVRSLRKTKPGDLLMTVNKGEGNAETLKKVIEWKLENTTIQIGGVHKKTKNSIHNKHPKRRYT